MNKQSICTGTGLVALDVILNGKPETPPKFHAGGSCGNVLSILAFLGWSSYPIARLAKNSATKEIEQDFKKWDVKIDLISKSREGSTPIIIHRILKDKKGNPKHRFEFKDPDTKSWLPQYKPVLMKDVDSIVKIQPKSKVFYFDRINRGAIDLAKANKANGAIVFFEPSSVGANISLFNECLQVADIIKFSHERISNYLELFPKQQVCLEIETRGVDGIRYRFDRTKNSTRWHNIKAHRIEGVVDSAGAGDWCSSGIIDRLCRGGRDSFNQVGLRTIHSAMQFGQLLGALNCLFDGARGMMYEVGKVEFENIINKIQQDINFNLNTLSFQKKVVAERKLIQISSLYS